MGSGDRDGDRRHLHRGSSQHSVVARNRELQCALEAVGRDLLPVDWIEHGLRPDCRGWGGIRGVGAALPEQPDSVRPLRGAIAVAADVAGCTLRTARRPAVGDGAFDRDALGRVGGIASGHKGHRNQQRPQPKLPAIPLRRLREPEQREDVVPAGQLRRTASAQRARAGDSVCIRRWDGVPVHGPGLGGRPVGGALQAEGDDIVVFWDRDSKAAARPRSTVRRWSSSSPRDATWTSKPGASGPWTVARSREPWRGGDSSRYRTRTWRSGSHGPPSFPARIFGYPRGPSPG